MPEPTVQLMGEAHDIYGGVEAEPLYVTPQGPMVRVELGEVVWVGFLDELRAAVGVEGHGRRAA